MKNVVFVAPFFLPATLRFVDAVARVAGARVGLVSQDPEEKLPPGLRARLAGHYRVEDGLDPRAIAAAVVAFGKHWEAPVDRLLGTLEQLQVPLAEARERLGIAGLGVEAARNFRDKGRMKDVLRAAGLPCARHRRAESEAEAWAFADQTGLPLVIKPEAGAGARDTFRVDRREHLAELMRAMPPSPQRPALLEEFITGEEHSFDGISVGGNLVWHSISRYFPGPLEVLRNPWIQWCVLLPRRIDGPAYQAIRSAGARALQALGMGTGLSHMEWFLRPDGSVAISEVGARPPGAQFTTLLSQAHDVDFYRLWAELVVHDTFTPPERRFAAGAAFLRGQGEGRVKAIHGLERAQRELGALVVEARLPSPGEPASGTYEGEGYVILRHPDTAVVEEGLRRLVTLVRVELG